jgi:hypothetical protein
MMRRHKLALAATLIAFGASGREGRAQRADAAVPHAANSASSERGTAGGKPDADDDEPSAGHASPAGARDDASRGNAAVPGMFEPPADTTDEDGTLAVGTIHVEIKDSENRAVSHSGITLGILHQSVAKGESREHRTAESDDQGAAVFDHLETGSGIAYRVTVPKDGATFAAAPFQLPQGKGMRVLLHVYPVAHDVQKALVVMQAIVYAELKDDRVQIQEAISVYNFGKVAWVPNDLVIKLPETFTALTGQQGMSDQGIDSVEKQGARLHGTFSPGRHDVEFRWQVPYDGEKEVDLDVGMPPHVAVMRAMAVASQDMKLVVEGLPEAVRQTDQQGQHLLVTEKQLRREDAPLDSVHISLQNLPTAGPGRIVATFLAGLGVAFGLAFALSSGQTRRPPVRKIDRARLLAELEELEAAKRTGDVGPKTYERARREIIDAIARTFASPPDRATTP